MRLEPRDVGRGLFPTGLAFLFGLVLVLGNLSSCSAGRRRSDAFRDFWKATNAICPSLESHADSGFIEARVKALREEALSLENRLRVLDKPEAVNRILSQCFVFLGTLVSGIIFVWLWRYPTPTDHRDSASNRPP